MLHGLHRQTHLALDFEDTMEEQEFVRLDDHSPVEILNECLGNLHMNQYEHKYPV